jgi:hypothetical protein
MNGDTSFIARIRGGRLGHQQGDMLHAMVRIAKPVPPKEIQGDPARVKQRARTPEIQSEMKKARRFPLGEREPNLWTSAEVPPGEYILSVILGRPTLPGQPPRPSISGSKSIVIPNDITSEVFNAGELTMNIYRPEDPVSR